MPPTTSGFSRGKQKIEPLALSLVRGFWMWGHLTSC
ncbi:hypothetical protein SLEP1_g33937 [Rubroshorea leprosula]|uniref:Uncharacterized protein n=1 Tax=Rubroshorea leprosula TaxID=152421 RepID=A0AAV5KI90_9ROSI|nr:hypothetical protein SLEP1_g33937 [Rubroshorea leprosula]